MAVGTCAGGDSDLAAEVQAEAIAGLVPSASAAVSEILALANAQLGIVGTETEQAVVVVCLVGDVALGTSLEMVMVAEGASMNTAMSVVLAVQWMEWKLDHVQLSMSKWWGRI